MIAIQLLCNTIGSADISPGQCNAETNPQEACSLAILLATYNGAAYLPEQLDSLFFQTSREWSLLVRDDCSTDATLSLLVAYQENHPDTITIIPNEGARLGPCSNFGILLGHADAPYIMFCDQDDVWLPDKIELTLRRMKELEERFGGDTPLLVHTDLKVVDSELNLIADSMWRAQRTNPNRTHLNQLLMQNCATGCTMMINRALRDLALPIPCEARMHDWWLMLAAGAFGKIGFIDIPTVLYRQHGANDSGAERISLAGLMGKVFDPVSRRKLNERRSALIAHQERQALKFLERYGKRLSAEVRDMLAAFSSISKRNFLMRRYYTVRYGFWYGSWLTNLGMMLFR